MIKKMKSKKIKKISTQEVLLRIFMNLLVIIAMAIALFPFYMLIVNSLKSLEEGLYFVWWPKAPSLDAFKYVLFSDEIQINFNVSVFNALWNTFKIAIIGVTCGTFFSAMAAYTFVKRDFPGKNLIFSIMMFTMMVPATVTMVSSYPLYSMIGWVNTMFPLTVPAMFGSIGLMFAFRQYMYGIPTELVESGLLDGANHFTIFLRIILPLAMPVIVAQYLLQFMSSYNAYEQPLLYLLTPDQFTIQLILPYFSNRVGMTDVPRQSAVTLLAMLPMFILYCCSQKFFEKGVMAGALKG